MDPDPYRAITEGERFVAETVGEQVCSLLAANHGLSLSQMDVLNLVADALLQVLPDIDLTPCPDQTAQELVSEFLADAQRHANRYGLRAASGAVFAGSVKLEAPLLQALDGVVQGLRALGHLGGGAPVFPPLHLRLV
jgi:hypothetical protein